MNEMNRRLCEKMAAGQLIYGTVLTSGSPLVTEMIAQCGYDVLWMDMEHSAIGIESLLTNMMAARSGGTPAWVRVPWNDPVRVKPVIDMGADGVIFPFIRTVEDAKRATNLHSQAYYGVMKAFGISGRNLVDFELNFIDKWSNNLGFSLDLISEACKRTIQATNQPSFQYADSILESWHKNNVHTLDDVAVLDSVYKKSKSVSGKPAAAKASAAAKSSAGGRFNNFPQRSYNYDQLEKRLLSSSIQ